jgi:TrmH family RNA methyltransferase
MSARTPGAIDSPRNSRILAARELRTAKGRREANALLVEGAHAVTTALAASCVVRSLFVTEAAADREVALLRSAARGGIAVHTVSERAFHAIGETVTPQGVVAVVEVPERSGLPAAPRLAVMLHECADPGNAGTVIRTADAAGADVVLLSARSADVWSGKCVRASAGSVFNVPISIGHETLAAVEEVRRRGCQVLATAADGDSDLFDLVEHGELAAPTAWLFGSEAHGLSTSLLDAADRVVRIPIHGRAESLNLAASAAICLYSSARAQRSPAAR